MQKLPHAEPHTPLREAPPASLNHTGLPALDSLCVWCRSEGEKSAVTSATTRRTGQISKPLSRLQEGARQGCWVCESLLAAAELWRLVDQVEYERLAQTNVRFDKQRFTLGAHSKLPRLQLYCPKGEPEVFRFNPDIELPPAASSEKTLDFIKYHLNQCLQGHSTCRDYQDQLSPGVNDNWPGRILKIDPEASTIQLVDFDPLQRPRYVALSYCWGTDKTQLVSKKETLPRLRAGIQITELPKTLRDAVKVTMNIGASFIWIDSMCIIQGDEDDWNREAAKMSTVYAQSLVTIIASSANACGEGFLERERQRSIEVARVLTQDGIAEVRARTIYDWGHHRGGPQSHENAYMQWMDPVDGRGWCLQERLLSGRYINFTSGEVQWGCLSARECECGQALYGKLYELSPSADEWFSIVEDYCSRKLKVATDRMTAMAGLARKFSTRFPEQWYCAGIWLSSQWSTLAARGILWRRGIDSTLSAFPADYLAPSFSWASLAGQPVHYSEAMLSECNFISTVVSGDMQYYKEDVFGRVTAGVLRMCGPLIKAKLSWDDTISYDDMKVGIKIDKVDRDYYRGCRVDGLLEKVPVPEGGFTVRRRPMTSEPREMSFDGVEVCLLPILSYELGRTSGQATGQDFPTYGNPLHHAECLLLVRSLKHPGFERLGVFTMSQWDTRSELRCEEVCIF